MTAALGRVGIEWRQSFIDVGGREMLCHFEAPNEEALRAVLVGGGAELRALWLGRFLPPTRRLTRARHARAAGIEVLAERHIASAGASTRNATVGELCSWCLDAHGVELKTQVIAHDGTRIVYLYAAPDIESVRLVHRLAGVPLDRAWAFRRAGPGATR
jgi:hypothetical protein